MSEAALAELSLVPLPAVDDGPPARAVAAASSAARSAFAATRLPVRHAEAERLLHRGPGWFDSSWELRCGCEVSEGWPGDAGVRDWIERWLYPGVGGGASLSAT